MSAPYDTILLDTVTWDYVVDAAGNWAKASPPYSIAQDVSSACRLILGELWYDSTQGIPYIDLKGNEGQVMGKVPPLSVIQEFLVNAALSVPGVVKAKAVIQSFSAATRQVTGQVQFVDVNGNPGSVSL
jgi:hypothetical protein